MRVEVRSRGIEGRRELTEYVRRRFDERVVEVHDGGAGAGADRSGVTS